MQGSARVINGTLLFLILVLAGLVALAWSHGGPQLVMNGLSSGGLLLYRYAPVLVVSFLAAGFADMLIPREWVRQALGSEAGLRGILIASGAGLVTPAGPFVSMPIAAVMLRAGAGTGAIVAFLTAWSLLALHRFVAWEIPILGWRFAAFRYGICLVLPVLAGLAARAVARS
jgi:uncharacterized membrane protein YraQ (UPF0718 family)